MLILKRVALAAAGLILVALSLLYAASEWRLRKTYDEPLIALRVAPSPMLVVEGERRAHVFGCTGCHHASGNVLFQAPGIGKLVAPNLTRVVPEYSDAEFIRLVRRGVKRDGTSVIAMPAQDFDALSDEDLAAILSWLRRQPRLADAEPARSSWGLIGRFAVATGRIPFSADHVVPYVAPLRRPVSTPIAEGSYLVRTICSHCHNLDSEHDDGWGTVTPPLRMMGQAYPAPDFKHLMRTGRGMGNRDLGLMSQIAREDLSHLTDPEIAAIHTYLNETEPETAAASE